MSKDNKSTYYDAGGIETLDIIKAKLTPEQYKGYLLGNALKYQCRMNFKTPDSPQRDAEKAANYSRYLAEFLAAQGNIDAPDGATHYRRYSDGSITYYQVLRSGVKRMPHAGWLMAICRQRCAKRINTNHLTCYRV